MREKTMADNDSQKPLQHSAPPVKAGSVIDKKISDHLPLIKDGILSMNLWGVGTRNGIQDEKIERDAMTAVKGNPYPSNVALIVKQRIKREIAEIIALLHGEQGHIDAICLQEFADNSHEPQVKRYFLEKLNAALMNNQLSEFSFQIDSHYIPKSDSGLPLLMHTGNESFAMLTLPNKYKYSVKNAKARNDLAKNGGQDNRVFEIDLKPISDKIAPRKIWNIHLAWKQNNAHSADLKAILDQAINECATVAGDTNVDNCSGLAPKSGIAKSNSLFSQPSNPQTGNVSLSGAGSTRHYVDLIATPEKAPHLSMQAIWPAAPIQAHKQINSLSSPRIEHVEDKSGKYLRLFFKSEAEAKEYSHYIFEEAGIKNSYGTGPRKPKQNFKNKNEFMIRISSDEFLKIKNSQTNPHLKTAPTKYRNH